MATRRKRRKPQDPQRIAEADASGVGIFGKIISAIKGIFSR